MGPPVILAGMVAAADGCEPLYREELLPCCPDSVAVGSNTFVVGTPREASVLLLFLMCLLVNIQANASAIIATTAPPTIPPMAIFDNGAPPPLSCPVEVVVCDGAAAVAESLRLLASVSEALATGTPPTGVQDEKPHSWPTAQQPKFIDVGQRVWLAIAHVRLGAGVVIPAGGTQPVRAHVYPVLQHPPVKRVRYGKLRCGERHLPPSSAPQRVYPALQYSALEEVGVGDGDGDADDGDVAIYISQYHSSTFFSRGVSYMQ